MDQNIPYSFQNFYRDVARYIRPYRGQFLIGCVFRFTSDVAHLFPAWAISQITVLFAQQQAQQHLQQLMWLFVGWGVAAVYSGFSRNFSKYLGYQVAEKASLDIYRECLSHLFKLDLSWQEQESSGNKMKRIDHGSDGINETIRYVFGNIIEIFVNTVGIVIVFSSLDIRLSLSLIFFIITYFLSGTFTLKRALHQEEVVNSQFERLGGLTFESLNNMHTIKALAIDGGILQKIRAHMSTLIVEIKKRIFLFQRQGIMLHTYELLYEFFIASYIAWGILHGQYNVGLLILFIGLFQKVSQSTGELTDITQALLTMKIWVSRAMQILNTSPEIEAPSTLSSQLLYPADWKTLRIVHLHFSYKRGQTLKDVSFTVKRGEKVGIVGLSGAGKSTLFKLLLDLYENYEGEILLDDVSLKQMRRQSYVDHVAVVFQDTELFNMSLKENIEIAAVHGNATSEKLLQDVIEMSHLDEVVLQLSNGVNTVIGEKGVKLSGGQRQRLGIARALYRQPDLLLLDEATSHLDVHSEKIIQEALHLCMQKFTTIVIAHRLSTVKAMDKIVVLEHGKIVEEGTFQQLLENNGTFARMWMEQKI